VTTLGDVQKLADLGLAGCIIGRALYQGNLDLTQAIASGAAHIVRRPAP
jgi:phosphoribosylformimino-5-aminoimidazole carboxamide ribotide isomerase